jgi:hypothetical protein
MHTKKQNKVDFTIYYIYILANDRALVFVLFFWNNPNHQNEYPVIFEILIQIDFVILLLFVEYNSST